MVQLLCPDNKNCNSGQWPLLRQQETTALAAGKRTIKADQESPLLKRRKVSSLQIQIPNKRSFDSNESTVPHSQYDLLNEPPVLGLQLRKSQSLLELLQARVSKARYERKEKDVKARVGNSGPVDNLKASNFPAVLLRIGEWEYVSKYEGDLVAKCYFAKHKLVWEVLDGGLKNKIEFGWEDIVGLKANCPDNGPSSLTIVLGKQPQFFRETNPQPRKHTLWQATTDFTDGEASRYRQHYLQCAQGVLKKHYQKLINCDTRLNLLSQQSDKSLDTPPAAKDSVKDPNVLNNNRSNQLGNTGTHGYVENWGLVRSKAIELVNVIMPQQTTSISDIVNRTAHCVSDQNSTRVNTISGEVNHNHLVKNISHILLNDVTRLNTPSDEKSPMSVVNYQGHEWVDGNDHSTPSCNLTPENENGMSRNDSFTDLLHQLPQIESLPRLFYDTSNDGDIMDF